MKILIIDDDNIHNFICERILKSTLKDPDISAITSCKKALEFLSENKDQSGQLPDLILLDINLPIMNGWDFLVHYEAIKTDLQKKIVICLLTSSLYEGDMNKSKEFTGIAEFISKPLTANVIRHLSQCYLDDK